MSQNIENNHRFQGQYFDKETGLHYNRFRYYDPHMARYISKDPIGLEGGINTSAYVADPTQWVDPLGLNKEKNNNFMGLNNPNVKDLWTGNSKAQKPLAINEKDWSKATQHYDRVANTSAQTQKKRTEDNNKRKQIQEKVKTHVQVPFGATLPQFPDSVVNFAAGFGDTLSFGATDKIRDGMGTNGVVNKKADSYKVGKATGLAHATLTGRGALLTAGGAKNILTGTGASAPTYMAANSYTIGIGTNTLGQIKAQVQDCNCLLVPDLNTNKIIGKATVSAAVSGGYTATMYEKVGGMVKNFQTRQLQNQLIK
jgi:RHS repeat-associated protein